MYAAIRPTRDSKNANNCITLDLPELLDRDDNKWKNSQNCDESVHVLQRFLAFKASDRNHRNAF